MPKKLNTQAPQGTLADGDHDAVVAIGTQHAQRISRSQRAERRSQRRKVRRLGLGQRHDVIINQRLHEQRPTQRRQYRANDAEHNKGKRQLVAVHHIGQNTLQSSKLLPSRHFLSHCSASSHINASSKSPPPCI